MNKIQSPTVDTSGIPEAVLKANAKHTEHCIDEPNGKAHPNHSSWKSKELRLWKLFREACKEAGMDCKKTCYYLAGFAIKKEELYSSTK